MLLSLLLLMLLLMTMMTLMMPVMTIMVSVTFYPAVQTSLDLVMQKGELNLTVDNLPPLMKGLDLDPGDEEVKDLILQALLNCEASSASWWGVGRGGGHVRSIWMRKNYDQRRRSRGSKRKKQKRRRRRRKEHKHKQENLLP